MSISGQHSQSFKSTWVSGSGTVAVGILAKDLAPEQIGVFDAGKNCDSEANVALSNPTFKKIKRAIIKQGVHAGTGDFLRHRLLNTPRETLAFGKDDIVSFEGVKARKGSKQHIIALGYNGIDASKSLNAKLDSKPMKFTFVLEGDPIQRYFGSNRAVYEIPLDKGYCPSGCDCTDTCGKVHCLTIQEGLMRAMKSLAPMRVLQNGFVVKRPLTDFVKISTISKCETTPTPLTYTNYKKWSISICDDGVTTLAPLSASVGKKVTLESRVDSVSTYSFWQLETAPAPSDFVLTKHTQPICGVCPTCPDTYTSVPAVKNIQIRVACGASAPVVTNAITTSLIASTLRGGDVYIVKVPTTVTNETIDSELTGCLEYQILGEESQLCVGSDVTFSWKSCETCKKTSKDYMITLGDKDCGTEDWLEELQAAYPSLVVSIDKAGTCVHTYKTTVMSDCIADEDCGKDEVFKFQPPATFNGQSWVEYVDINTIPSCDVTSGDPLPCCACGIIVVGKVFTQNYLECQNGWETYDPNQVLGIKVHVTATSYDYTGNPCDETKEFVTVLQQPKLPKGTSGLRVQQYEKHQLLYENKFFSSNPFLNQVSGFALVSKPHLFYDSYTLVLKRHGHDVTYIQPEQNTMAYTIYVPEGQGKQIEALLNPLVLSAGKEELHAVIL